MTEEKTEFEIGLHIAQIEMWQNGHDAVKDYTDKSIEKLKTKLIKDQVRIDLLEKTVESLQNQIDMINTDRRNNSNQQRMSKILGRIEKLIWDKQKTFTYAEVYEALHGTKKNEA